MAAAHSPETGWQSAYRERARSYNRDTSAFQPHREAIVEALPVRAGQVVIDVGCGTGLCCGLLREKVGPQGGVVGILQSPDALRNVMTKLRPGAPVAAGDGKWAAPWMVPLNYQVRMLHAPYVRSFGGFGQPWSYLKLLLEDVHVQELAFGSGYIMTGQAPMRPKS